MVAEAQDNEAALSPLPLSLKVPFSLAIAFEQQAANQYMNHRNTSKTNGFWIEKWSGKWIFKLSWEAFARDI